MQIYADTFAVEIPPGLDTHAVKIHFGLDVLKSMPNFIVTSDIVAKELAMILVKTLKQREVALGHPIILPESFYRQAGIAPEDF